MVSLLRDVTMPPNFGHRHVPADDAQVCLAPALCDSPADTLQALGIRSSGQQGMRRAQRSDGELARWTTGMRQSIKSPRSFFLRYRLDDTTDNTMPRLVGHGVELAMVDDMGDVCGSTCHESAEPGPTRGTGDFSHENMRRGVCHNWPPGVANNAWKNSRFPWRAMTTFRFHWTAEEPQGSRRLGDRPQPPPNTHQQRQSDHEPQREQPPQGRGHNQLPVDPRTLDVSAVICITLDKQRGDCQPARDTQHYSSRTGLSACPDSSFNSEAVG